MQLLVVALIAGGTAFLVTWLITTAPQRHPDVLLGSPRVKYLVLARTFADAHAVMRQYDRADWRYINQTSDLLGYRRGDVEFRLGDGWAQHPIFTDGFAVTRLKALGLSAHFLHETQL